MGRRKAKANHSKLVDGDTGVHHKMHRKVIQSTLSSTMLTIVVVSSRSMSIYRGEGREFGFESNGLMRSPSLGRLVQ